MPLRTLIVDDEPLARERLRLMLADHADVEIVGESADAEEALQAIRQLRPDVVLLDVQMPGADGFGVVGTLSLVHRPFVVFVTAHAEHAARAFDVDAVDYLLKPYDEERLAQALSKARRALHARDSNALAVEVRALTDAIRKPAHPAAPSVYLTRFTVTVGPRTLFLAADDVDWIEADRNYLALYAGEKRYIVRGSISAIAEKLDPARFVRVHRSAIVRRDRVRELRQLPTGELRVVLASGAIVAVSMRYRDALLT